jgi:hypothetical protein
MAVVKKTVGRFLSIFTNNAINKYEDIYNDDNTENCTFSEQDMYNNEMYYDQLYSKNYSFLNRKNKHKTVSHISIDKNGVMEHKMHNIGRIQKCEKKTIKIHSSIRKKYGYINYPFYNNNLTSTY